MNKYFMRRNELESQSYQSDFEFLCNKVDIGYLGLIDRENYPRIIPVNFVALGWDIYFHGSLEGEKYDLLTGNPKATFSVDFPYSFIPSYWSSESYACPASHYFKSLFLRGKGSIVDSIETKVTVLQKLMEKYQPEGNYKKISEDLSIYKNALKNVGVFKIEKVELSIKVKLGQNESDKTIDKIVYGLRDRGSEIDLLTVDEIMKLRMQ
ncbi:MAG: flavin-nucleotide-binding protein [Candidatus Heimdallarchaeota archaeon]|nr:flavin-nucleotide-binding protein [Candidatus Heimdallarchaeota archaeon]